MATYRVTDRDTGKTLELTGDLPPTEKELMQIFAQHQSPKGSPGRGFVEAAATIASGIVAEPVAGLAGIAGAILPGKPGQGRDWVEGTRDAMTYQPTTETGKRYINNFAETMKPVAQELEKGAEFLAKKGEDIATPFLFTFPEEERQKGMAVGHSAGKSSFAALEIALGTKIGGKVLSGISGAGRATPKTPRIDPRVEGIKLGNTDTAKLEVGPKGKVQGSPTAKAAIYQGMEPGMVASVKAASATDKNAMRRMLDIVEIGRNNKLAGATLYPSSVAGKNISKQIAHVARVNRDAGKRLDSVAKSVLPGKQVDYTEAVDNFIASLDDLGIDFNNATLNFKGSDIQGLSGNEAVLKRVVSWMRDADKTDAYAVHRLKRYLDENVSYGKRQEGVTAKVQAALKDLRHNLDALLDEAFPEYNQINTTYAETIGALNEFQGVVGKRINFNSPSADRALGIEARKLLSNYASGSAQLDGLKRLATVANKYGGKFDDDIVMQTLFYVELQRLFPETFRTTFKSEIQKGVEAAVRSPVDAAKNAAVEKGIEILMGRKGEDELLKALRKLLDASPSGPPQKSGLPVPRQ